MSESENETEIIMTALEWDGVLSKVRQIKQVVKEQEERVISLERGLEAVLRRLEASGQADDEPGWYGRPE
jgi:hypothetical protein